MYRLTNTTHTEIAPSLPLPSLPVCFGAASQDLVLFEDKESASYTHNSAALVTHAGKIAELLTGTDISYLSVRDGSTEDTTSISAEPGGLLAAVLEHDPEAFSYARSEQVSQRGWRNTTSEKRPPIIVGSAVGDIHEGHASQTAQKSSTAQNLMDTVPSPSKRRSKMRRKVNLEAVDPVASPQYHLDTELDAVLAGFCEVLESVFEKMDSPDEDDGEGGFSLPYTDLKLIADEVATAHVKNILQLLPTGHLVKLLSLLDRQVQLAHERSIDDDDDDESENFIAITSALEAVQTSLIIMTHQGMPKQVYKEEIIDRIIGFSRYQIVHSIFTAYDPVYKQLHKGGEIEDDEDDDIEVEAGGGSARKGRRKSKGQRFKRPSSNKVSVPVSSVLQKLCSILSSMKDLLSVERLMDSTVLQLIKTVLATFGVENIQLLQLKAIGVACTVFVAYPQHRTVILDEILSLLWKLPLSKRNLRTYHLPDEESKQIQMLTALLLQLVQCSVNLPELCENAVAPGTVSDTDVVPSTAPKNSDPAMEASTYFWRNVLQRWTMPKAHEGADVKILMENLIVDLLTTLNAPEFPAANVLLQVLCVLLFGSAGLKSKDAAIRATAIELLGQIAARLKHDSIACGVDKLWVFQVAHEIDKETRAPKDTCVSCNAGRSSKLIVTCDSCHRWFHGDCVGVTGHDFLSRGWLCHCCLCKRQLVSLETYLKAQATDGKLRYKNVKGIIESRAPDDVTVPKKGVAILQQMLLNYLDEAAASDSTAAYAKRFYLWQWYRDDPQGEQNLPFYHGRWSGQASHHGFGIVPTPFTRDIIVRIAAMLGQQRPLARGFDRILERLLVSLQENSPTPRAKALRAVSAIVEVDPGVLGDERVQRAVEGRFLDSAISVREAAMELVGRHIASHPDVAVKYFEKIAERIMDTGVSVRKRVIKIIRDLCISKCEFSKATDACVRILSRINDEETSIQDLVCKTFYELWFEEPANQNTTYSGDDSVVPSEIAERVQQLVDVLKCLQNHQAMVIIVKRSLALDFSHQTAKNSAASLVSQATVRNRCELMCKCLIENILKAEEGPTEEAETRALPYVLALHSFCMVDPTLCTPASDPSRYAVTLQPYLKTQVDNRDVAQLLQSIVFVVDTVLPLLRRPPPNFVEELERDLRQLIVRYSFLTVVHACIKCLCSLGKVAAKGLNSFEFLVRKFYKLLDNWRQNQFGASEKPNVLRCLFCLGLLVRYGASMIDAMDDKETSMQQLLQLYKHYLLSEDFDIKARSLQALGFFFIARPEFMMERDMGRMIEATLSSSADLRIKIQSLRNFHDYLVDVEEKMGCEAGNEAPERGTHGSGAVPVAAGAGDNNICGGIIQLHWDSILERCLDMNDQVRQAALKVVEIVLRQGLVHPMTCVPHLIALEVDQHESNSKLAHRLLSHMNEKYPSFFESRLGDGLQLSFKFIESGAASSCQTSPVVKSSSTSRGKLDATLAVSAKMGISRTYKLIRNSRVSRNKFISSVVRKFDVGTWGLSSLSFLMYCTEILASLPFSLPDEPLYLVYAINRVVQVRAGGIESTIKKLISEGPLEEAAKHAMELLAAERQRDSENAYNLDAVQPQMDEDCTDVDDTQGIPEDAVSKLKDECLAAAALGLLLRLKRHVKIAYSLNDARCQAFTPTEAIKPGDTLCKQNVKDFSFKGIPTSSAKTIKHMLKQYQAFKRLMKEDSMDYSTYSANLSRKRNRMSTAPSDRQPVDGGDLGIQVNGHMHNLRPVRRKSAPIGRKTEEENLHHDGYIDADENDDAALDEDDDDGDEDDDNYGGKSKKRRRSSAAGRPRSKKQSL